MSIASTRRDSKQWPNTKVTRACDGNGRSWPAHTVGWPSLQIAMHRLMWCTSRRVCGLTCSSSSSQKKIERNIEKSSDRAASVPSATDLGYGYNEEGRRRKSPEQD